VNVLFAFEFVFFFIPFPSIAQFSYETLEVVDGRFSRGFCANPGKMFTERKDLNSQTSIEFCDLKSFRC
jgi:hypothetical protein